MGNPKTYILLAFVLSVGISGCTKVVDEPTFDVKPVIRLQSQSRDTIRQGMDSLVLVIEYKDGDGDLGNTDPDVPSIFIQDSRLSKPDQIHLAPLAPPDAKVSIQGTINVVLPDLFILGGSKTQSIDLSLYLFDRAGNQSNTINIPKITITKE